MVTFFSGMTYMFKQAVMKKQNIKKLALNGYRRDFLIKDMIINSSCLLNLSVQNLSKANCPKNVMMVGFKNNKHLIIRV